MTSNFIPKLSIPSQFIHLRSLGTLRFFEGLSSRNTDLHNVSCNLKLKIVLSYEYLQFIPPPPLQGLPLSNFLLLRTYVRRALE